MLRHQCSFNSFIRRRTEVNMKRTDRSLQQKLNELWFDTWWNGRLEWSYSPDVWCQQNVSVWYHRAFGREDMTFAHGPGPSGSPDTNLRPWAPSPGTWSWEQNRNNWIRWGTGSMTDASGRTRADAPVLKLVSEYALWRKGLAPPTVVTLCWCGNFKSFAVLASGASLSQRQQPRQVHDSIKPLSFHSAA